MGKKKIHILVSSSVMGFKYDTRGGQALILILLGIAGHSLTEKIQNPYDGVSV